MRRDILPYLCRCGMLLSLIRLTIHTVLENYPELIIIMALLCLDVYTVCFVSPFQISSMIDEDIRVDLLNTKQRNLLRPLVRFLIDDPSLLISPNDSHSNHRFTIMCASCMA